MARIKDEKNICLHCRHVEKMGRDRHADEKEFRTWCVCDYARGRNRGYRKTCTDYEPQKEG